MKISFNRKQLCAVFPPLMSAVSNKSTITAIEGVLIEAGENNNCILTTYDTEKGICLSVEAKVYSAGKYIINAQKLSQIIRVMDGEEIEISIDSKASAKLESGRSSHRMSALPGEDFPALPKILEEKGFVISQALLKEMMVQVAHSMGVDDTRPALNGCHFRVEKDVLTLVSCDSFSLSKLTKKAEIKNKGEDVTSLDYSFIVPVKTVNELIKLLCDDEEETVEIYMTRKNIIFKLGNITFFSRLIEGEYIDYNRIILRNHKIKVTVDQDEFLAALERAALVTEERIAGSVRSPVMLEVSDNILKIKASSSAGSTYEEIPIKHEGDDILIRFNNRFLINNVRVCTGEQLRLSMSSPLTSMNIEAEEATEGGEEIFMLLPIRPNRMNE